MEIKNFSTEYLDGVAEIERACFSNPWDKPALEAELNNACAHIYVATDGGRVIGYAMVYCVCGEVDIARVAVMPEYRRMGIATQLLKKSFEDNEAECVFLDVRESNAAAIKLYESLGFEEVGVRKNYYNDPTENAVLMKRGN